MIGRKEKKEKGNAKVKSEAVLGHDLKRKKKDKIEKEGRPDREAW